MAYGKQLKMLTSTQVATDPDNLRLLINLDYKYYHISNTLQYIYERKTSIDISFKTHNEVHTATLERK